MLSFIDQLLVRFKTLESVLPIPDECKAILRCVVIANPSCTEWISVLKEGEARKVVDRLLEQVLSHKSSLPIFIGTLRAQLKTKSFKSYVDKLAKGDTNAYIAFRKAVAEALVRVIIAQTTPLCKTKSQDREHITKHLKSELNVKLIADDIKRALSNLSELHKTLISIEKNLNAIRSHLNNMIRAISNTVANISKVDVERNVKNLAWSNWFNVRLVLAYIAVRLILLTLRLLQLKARYMASILGKAAEFEMTQKKNEINARSLVKIAEKFKELDDKIEAIVTDAVKRLKRLQEKGLIGVMLDENEKYDIKTLVAELLEQLTIPNEQFKRIKSGCELEEYNDNDTNVCLAKLLDLEANETGGQFWYFVIRSIANNIASNLPSTASEDFELINKLVELGKQIFKLAEQFGYHGHTTQSAQLEQFIEDTYKLLQVVLNYIAEHVKQGSLLSKKPFITKVVKSVIEYGKKYNGQKASDILGSQFEIPDRIDLPHVRQSGLRSAKSVYQFKDVLITDDWVIRVCGIKKQVYDEIIQAVVSNSNNNQTDQAEQFGTLLDVCFEKYIKQKDLEKLAKLIHTINRAIDSYYRFGRYLLLALWVALLLLLLILLIKLGYLTWREAYNPKSVTRAIFRLYREGTIRVKLFFGIVLVLFVMLTVLGAYELYRKLRKRITVRELVEYGEQVGKIEKQA